MGSIFIAGVDSLLTAPDCWSCGQQAHRQNRCRNQERYQCCLLHLSPPL